MLAYLIRRLLLMVPTLFGIMVINFVIIQAAPGGPVEQMLSQIQGTAAARPPASPAMSATPAARSQTDTSGGGAGTYRGARGLTRSSSSASRSMYGFDKPCMSASS